MLFYKLFCNVFLYASLIKGKKNKKKFKIKNTNETTPLLYIKKNYSADFTDNKNVCKSQQFNFLLY